jgi:hypothetical protein
MTGAKVMPPKFPQRVAENKALSTTHFARRFLAGLKFRLPVKN